MKPPPKLLFLYTALFREKLRDKPPMLALDRSTSSTILFLLFIKLPTLVGLIQSVFVLRAPCFVLVLFVARPSLAIVSRSNSFETRMGTYEDCDAHTGCFNLSYPPLERRTALANGVFFCFASFIICSRISASSYIFWNLSNKCTCLPCLLTSEKAMLMLISSPLVCKSLSYFGED